MIKRISSFSYKFKKICNLKHGQEKANVKKYYHM